MADHTPKAAASGEPTYFVRTIEGTQGPHSASELQDLQQSGRISKTAVCRVVGSMDWVEVSRITLTSSRNAPDGSPDRIPDDWLADPRPVPKASQESVGAGERIGATAAPLDKKKVFVFPIAVILVLLGQVVVLSVPDPGPFWLAGVFIPRLAHASGAVLPLAFVAFFVPMLSAARKKKTIREVASSMEPSLTGAFVSIWLLVAVGIPILNHYSPPPSVRTPSASPAVAPSLETQLTEIARDINRSLPLTSDGVETLGAAATGRMVHFKYRFVSLHKDDINIETLRKKAFSQSQSQACTDPDTKALLDAGATISKTYVDANHEHLVTYKVTAADCGLPAPAR